jgi:hypothetical protein
MAALGYQEPTWVSLLLLGGGFSFCPDDPLPRGAEAGRHLLLDPYAFTSDAEGADGPKRHNRTS